MVTFFDEMISSSLRVGFPGDKVNMLDDFRNGSMVKIKCGLDYKHDDCSLSLTARSINMINSVQLVVD